MTISSDLCIKSRSNSYEDSLGLQLDSLPIITNGWHSLNKTQKFGNKCKKKTEKIVIFDDLVLQLIVNYKLMNYLIDLTFSIKSCILFVFYCSVLLFVIICRFSQLVIKSLTFCFELHFISHFYCFVFQLLVRTH